MISGFIYATVFTINFNNEVAFVDIFVAKYSQNGFFRMIDVIPRSTVAHTYIWHTTFQYFHMKSYQYLQVRGDLQCRTSNLFMIK